MRQLLASTLVTFLLVGAMAPAASAGGATNAALGLASFAVFTQLFGGLFHPEPHPVYTAPVVYAPYPVAYPPPAPMPTVIQYPHGRYELRGDGVAAPYYWVWIPNPPPPPAPPPQPGLSGPSAPPSASAPSPSADPYHP